MHTTTASTSTIPAPRVGGVPLGLVKDNLIKVAEDAGSRPATVANKNYHWTRHIRILAETGVMTTGDADRRGAKEALISFRLIPNRITGGKQSDTHCLTHGVHVIKFWEQAYVHHYMDTHLLEGAELPRADEAYVVVPRDEDVPVMEQAIRWYYDRILNPDMRYSRNTVYLERHCQRSMVKFCLAISSGLRRFEISNVKGDDIDFDRMTITLPVTKGRTVRVVPMSARTAAEIKALLAMLAPTERTGYLIRGELGDPMTPAAVSRQMERIWHWGIAQGMPLKPFTLHSLRHRAISDMLQISPEHARVMAGHKDVRTTTRIYGHTTIEDVQETHKRADVFSRLADQRKSEPLQGLKAPRRRRVF